MITINGAVSVYRFVDINDQNIAVVVRYAVESREETEEGDGSGRHDGTDAADLHVH